MLSLQWWLQASPGIVNNVTETWNGTSSWTEVADLTTKEIRMNGARWNKHCRVFAFGG